MTVETPDFCSVCSAYWLCEHSAEHTELIEVDETMTLGGRPALINSIQYSLPAPSSVYVNGVKWIGTLRADGATIYKAPSGVSLA